MKKREQEKTTRKHNGSSETNINAKQTMRWDTNAFRTPFYSAKKIANRH